MLRDALIERLEWTVYDIAMSPRVESFVIGYTATSVEQRFQTYQKMEYESVVTLASHLTMKDALDLEGALATQDLQNESSASLVFSDDTSESCCSVDPA